jgi:Helix-turn-helix domain
LGHDKTTIPQHAVQASASPHHGEPYNYSRIMDAVMIPQVVYADRKLSPGARLLWGIIRRLGHRTGQCFASEVRLAEELAVTVRQVRRYCKQLVGAGLLQEREQPGRPSIRELLWHTRFNGEQEANKPVVPCEANVRRIKSLPADAQPRTDMSGGSGHFCPGGLDISVRPDSYSGVLEASLEAASPSHSAAPPPGLKTEVKTSRREGEEKTTAASALGLAPTAAEKGRGARAEEAAQRQDSISDQKAITSADRSPAQLAKFVRFQYLVLMNAEPPIDGLNAIVRILRARHADHIAYAVTMSNVLKVLREPATVGIWLRKAVEAGTELTSAEVMAADD